MTRRRRPWHALKDRERADAVQQLLDAGQAQSIIAYKLGATPSAIAVVIKKIRQADVAAAASLKKLGTRPASSPPSAPANLAAPDGEPGIPSSLAGGAKNEGVSPALVGRPAEAGTSDAEREQAVAPRPWADRHLAEQRDIVQSALLRDQRVGEIAERFGCSATEIASLLDIVFRRALDADFPQTAEEAVETPTIAAPAPLVEPAPVQVGATTWSAMTRDQKDAAVLAGRAEGQSAHVMAERLKGNHHTVTSHIRDMRRRGIELAAPPVCDPITARRARAAVDGEMLTGWAGMTRDERDAAVIAARIAGEKVEATAARLGAPKGTLLSWAASMRKRGVTVPAGHARDAKAALEANRQRRAEAKVKKAKANLPQHVAGPLPAELPAKVEKRIKPRLAEPAEPLIVIAAADAFHPLPGIVPVPFGSTGCKWSVDGRQGSGMFWCGGPRVEGSSYCRHHTRLAYTPAAKRSPRAKADDRLNLQTARASERWLNA